MKGQNEIRSKGIPKKDTSGTKSNLAVFAFFLLLSFVFWYLNSLGKELEADINYPVRYIGLPKEMEFVDRLPEKLNIYLKGPGYSLFKLKYSGNRTPAIIDFSKISYRRVQGRINSDYYLITSSLIHNFTTQLKTECKITSIKPDTLFFHSKG